jgi:hypothetical protein
VTTTAATISPWPLVRRGDQQHPVKTLLRAQGDDVVPRSAGGAVRAARRGRARIR